MDGILLTFQALCEKYQLPTKDFFKYLQIKSFLSAKFKDTTHIPKLSSIEELIEKKGEKGQLSKYYNLIMLNSKDSAVDKLKWWRRDIQEETDDSEWNEAV